MSAQSEPWKSIIFIDLIVGSLKILSITINFKWIKYINVSARVYQKFESSIIYITFLKSKKKEILKFHVETFVCDAN